MPKPLEKEYEYYLTIRDDLAREHHGKLVAIKGRQALGIFDDYRSAANAVYAIHERGTVLIQELGRDIECYSREYHAPEIDTDDGGGEAWGQANVRRQSPRKKPLESDFEYFLEIWPELVRDHAGKFVAIKNKEVLGIYTDYLQAARAVYVEHERGTVLMQDIGHGPEAFTIYLHTPGVVPSQ